MKITELNILTILIPIPMYVFCNTTPNNSPTPAGDPAIQLSSDTLPGGNVRLRAQSHEGLSPMR